MLLNFDRLGWWKLVLIGITLLTTAFLLLPILFIAALSFGSSQWLIFPPPGWTLRWYPGATRRSPLAGLRLDELPHRTHRYGAVGPSRSSHFFWSEPRAVLVSGSVEGAIPDADDPARRRASRGALYAFFLQIGLNGTLTGFVISHLVLALPFSILSITNALEGFDKSIEDAAVLCGASPFEAKIRVTLPAISHGVFSAAIFSFLTSWDEVVVAIFMASPTLQTLPVKVWSTLRQDLTPVVAAASTLLILLTVLLMVLVAIVRKGLKS
ncbi:ABC transporter permease subunit (plasmid) [Sinorhizobium meliloti]|nr:ABC transporter permease subunit [Sinorhizobium meliloti]